LIEFSTCKLELKLKFVSTQSTLVVTTQSPHGDDF